MKGKCYDTDLPQNLVPEHGFSVLRVRYSDNCRLSTYDPAFKLKSEIGTLARTPLGQIGSDLGTFPATVMRHSRRADTIVIGGLAF